MRRHGFTQFILPTGLSLVLIALAACGGQSQDEAAPPADPADETSQATTGTENNEALDEQLIDPQPKELTDGEWVAALANHNFMKEHYPVLLRVDDKNEQFYSFFGTVQDYGKKANGYSGDFNIEAVNPPECAELLIKEPKLTESHVSSVEHFSNNIYRGKSAKQGGLMPFETVAVDAFQSNDKDFPGWYWLNAFVFKPSVAEQIFSNFVASWSSCEEITYLKENKPGKSDLTWPNLQAEGALDQFFPYFGENFFILHFKRIPSKSEDLWLIRTTGNVIEVDQYQTTTLHLSKILNLSNKRARALAKAQGIEVEDIDIENLDKYKVNDSTVFPEYKEIKNPNYS